MGKKVFEFRGTGTERKEFFTISFLLPVFYLSFLGTYLLGNCEDQVICRVRPCSFAPVFIPLAREILCVLSDIVHDQFFCINYDVCWTLALEKSPRMSLGRTNFWL